MMTIYDENEIYTQREYLVVKGNELIQKSRFELTLAEQKTIAFVCSMIKPIKLEDSLKKVPFQLEYEFDIREYCKICGIDYSGGKNYRDVKDTLKKLSDRSMWLDDGETETLMRWLAYVQINKRGEKILIEVDRTIAPYLFQLKEKFTQYHLFNILAMKSAFSVRLYELMKSYSFQKKKIFELDELKKTLMVDNVVSYKDFSLFRKKVIEKAQEEINELTDINISFNPIKKGRKVVKIEFIIENKEMVERITATGKVDEKLRKVEMAT